MGHISGATDKLQSAELVGDVKIGPKALTSIEGLSMTHAIPALR